MSAPTALAMGSLLAVTAAWGSTFPLLKDVVDRVPVTDFLAVRFLVAAVVLTLAFPSATGRLTPAERTRAVLLGLFYGGGQVLQTLGLQTTPASVSGFLTGTYVVLTPLLGMLVLRARVGRAVWLATALATAGLAVLSLDGVSIGGGELLTLGGAVLYAAHIVGLGRWSSSSSALGLTVVQLWTTTAVCAVGALPGGIVVPPDAGVWAALALTAGAATALAFVVQTWAQAHLAPARAAVVMTMEPVFAGLFAVLVGGEVLGARVLLGGALVLGAMYLAELGPQRTPDLPPPPQEAMRSLDRLLS